MRVFSILTACALAFVARTATADSSSRIVTNNARGSMVQTYNSGPGNAWSRTTDITQRSPRGSVRTVYNTGGPGNNWSKTTEINERSPRGSVNTVYTSGSGNTWSKTTTITQITPRGAITRTFTTGSAK
jgi:hypothetical protein